MVTDSAVVEPPQSAAADLFQSKCEAANWEEQLPDTREILENLVSGHTVCKKPAKSTILKKEKDSAVVEQSQLLVVDLSKSSWEVTAGLEGVQQDKHCYFYTLISIYLYFNRNN